MTADTELFTTDEQLRSLAWSVLHGETTRQAAVEQILREDGRVLCAYCGVEAVAGRALCQVHAEERDKASET